jgi:quaternary ammonium compound-resistance protein SugE
VFVGPLETRIVIKAWLFLFAAGVCEIIWAAGLKKFGLRLTAGGVFTIVMMLLSFVLLDRAMRHLPLGTAYAIWTGIGAVGAAILGMLWMNEPRDPVRIACIGLIVAGIVGLKWFTPAQPPAATTTELQTEARPPA